MIKLKIKLVAGLMLSCLAVSFAQQNEHLTQLREILEEKTALQRQSAELNNKGNKSTQIASDHSFSSNASGGEAETFIAVNPTNPNNLVASYMDGQNTLSFPVYYSNDAGTTWNKSSFDVNTQLIADYPGHIIGGGGDPVFTYDDNGKCYFSWIYLSLKNGAFDTAYMNMFWAYSTDGGQNWQVESNHKIGGGALLLSFGVVTGVAQVGNGIFDRQWMDVDRSGGAYDGNVYATTLFIPHASSTFSSQGMVLNRMTGGTGGFQQVSYVGTGTTQFGNIKVDQSNGTIHVTYCDVAANKLFHSKSIDGGGTFSTPVEIASTGSLKPNVTNRIHSRENAASSLAIDNGGNLHVVWSSYSQGDFASYYSNSTDGGASWSTPLLIDGLLGSGKSFMPTVAASGNNVSISTYSISGVKQSVYKTISSVNNGQSFLPAQVVSGDTTNYQGFSQQSFFGDYDCSAMDGCTLYSTWSDGRGFTPVVYVAKTDACLGVGIGEFSPINGDVNIGDLYPMPARGYVNLPINSSVSGYFKGQLISIDGKVVDQWQLDFSSDSKYLKIELPQLAAGIYFLNLETDKGLRFSRKLVVE